MGQDRFSKQTLTSRSIQSEPLVSLSSLPSELIINIVSHLKDDRKALSTLCQVSKSFDALVRPVLWEHIVLTPRHYTPPSKWAFDPISNNPKEVLGGIFVSKRFENSYQGLLGHVKILIIRDHTVTWFKTKDAGRWTPSFPNLRTLDITSSNPCLNDHSSRRKTPCRLLAGIANVDYLIVRGGIDMNAICIPSVIWKSPKEIIGIVPTLFPSFDPPFIPAKLGNDVEPLRNLLSLVFIVPPPSIYETISSYYTFFLISFLRLAAGHPKLKVTFVGEFRYLPNQGPMLEHDQVVADLRRELDRKLSSLGWKAEEVSERQDRLEFWKLQDWLDDGRH
ncbi:uncharacterized protein I303_102012 [Kwoniella dejecticola CBS 10117]|uniref:F-box domain-containing protein n=1 Tax=Kwoniella dejecticola CBS 10117 TaxID=1296121 RepID=A0A1A6AC51_9TREE|nr:uncharacterized protein I303_01850 [Kwoniella dejecticola CBS 10117]OBR87642.1 hypothetical protein I303_01850 [Kwoniella dejecticola CBS 10117]